MSLNDEPIEVRKQYLKIAADYAMPIAWADKEKILNNGTAFVLHTGTNTFVVTAAHVYEGYLAAKAEGSVAACQLMEIDFELEQRLICARSSGDMDIATFAIDNNEIKSLGKNVLFGSQSTWPPKKPNEQEAIVVAGFPGIERIEIKKRNYSFGVHCFNTPASSIGPRHFGCSFDRQYWVDVFGHGLPEELYDLGGISGAPALALEKSKSGIISWRLAGIVYQATASEVMGEILLVHHACFINPDGAIEVDILKCENH